MLNLSLSLKQQHKLTQIQRLSAMFLTLQEQDLNDFLRRRAEENPLLEIYYPMRTAVTDGTPPDFVREKSPQEILFEQLALLNAPDRITAAAKVIIGALDEKGFFTDPELLKSDTRGFSDNEIACALALVQSLDPPGIGARSLREALILQCKRKGDAPPHTLTVLEAYYDAFLNGRWQRLRKELSMSDADLQAIIDFLRPLSFQPLRQLDTRDVYIRPEGKLVVTDRGDVSVILFQTCPILRFRDDLYAAYGKNADKETLAYLRKARHSYVNLRTALTFRSKAIRLVLEAICYRQHDFFLHDAALHPLTQKEIARITGLSEATVSRVCKNRCVLFNRRVCKIQDFLTRAYDNGTTEPASADEIKRTLLALIAAEDRVRPYSDQVLANMLAEKGLPIARRTVAKLRLAAGIPNSTVRKQRKTT